MDAAELLGGPAPFVIDTSAWARLPKAPADLLQKVQRAVIDDRVWITPICRMEILFTARNHSEYVTLEGQLDLLRILRNDRAVADAAMRAVADLAVRGSGYHRLPFTDALIAAGASEHGGVAVLHHDVHFDRLAEVLVFDSVRLPAP